MGRRCCRGWCLRHTQSLCVSLPPLRLCVKPSRRRRATFSALPAPPRSLREPGEVAPGFLQGALAINRKTALSHCWPHDLRPAPGGGRFAKVSILIFARKTWKLWRNMPKSALDTLSALSTSQDCCSALKTLIYLQKVGFLKRRRGGGWETLRGIAAKPLLESHKDTKARRCGARLQPRTPSSCLRVFV